MGDISKRLAELSPEKRALLTKRLQQKMASRATKEAIPQRDNLNDYPLSYAQERMWFLDQWDPGSPTYNISAALRLKGQLHIEVLEKSLNEIIKRHEVLRASFITENEHPKQTIAPELYLPLSVIDLSHLSASEKEAKALQLATDEARKPFDLTRAPLLRVSVLQLGKNECVLLFTMHHIISDGWSIGVLIKEFAILYDANIAGKSSPLEILPIQYADFAVWQKEWLQGDVLENQLAYWKKQLDDSSPALELPTDHLRPVYQSYRGAHHTVTLAREIHESLKKLSHDSGVTLFTTLLAAFNILLNRYTRQDDINVGTPIANRHRIEIEGLIGFFVNTLVMRTNLAGNPRFRELVKRVNETALEAFAHQDVPFEMLVEKLKPQRDMSHTPFFQVMFALQDARVEMFELPGMNISLLEAESGTAKFDIILFAEEQKDGLKLAFEYNTDLFDASTISRMALHLENLLKGIIHHPDQRIAALSLLSQQERNTIVNEWNATQTDYPGSQSLAPLFEAQVLKTPDQVAVDYEGNQLSYHELNQRANKLAHYLRKQGIDENDFVAIVMERSVDLIVTTLAIIKAGGVYVPLDISYPKERMAFMLEDTQAPVIMTQKALLDLLPENQARVICIDSDWNLIEQESGNNPVATTTGDSLAYVIYTSGSTGRPKGVAVPHRAISRLVLNTNYVQFAPTDRIAQASNASFDAATFEIWGAFLNGATLVGITKDVVLSTYEFVKFFQDQKIDTMFLTTSLFNQIANEIPNAFRTLKHLSFGGEAGDPNSARKVARSEPPLELLNAYGPTENTTFTTWFIVKDVPDGATSLPIGKPISNTTLYVLDEHFQPVPVGIPGELFLGGDGLLQQYYNRPDLTAEKLIPNPFCHEPGARLYRTGDLVRYLPDGNIDFMGRIDHQVKIRGFRIELGEIESLLKKHPDIRDSIVLVREDKPGVKRLVSYIVAQDAGVPKTSDLRNFLLEKLPDYMVPSIFIPMEKFPINPNGKVDRKALPVPDQSRPELEKSYVAPRTKFEKTLAKMWQEILGIEQIGIYDNFFELGGNSLQAAVFINKLQKEVHEKVHVRSIFLAPTIAEFSTYANEYYADVIAKYFGEESSDGVMINEFGDTLTQIKKIDETKIKQMRVIITPLPPRKAHQAGESKNPPAIFVLSPPRSGSTLFRVMLAGNPQLFAPPELDLLSFNTLEERTAAFADDYTIWLEATWRAIMEIKSCELPEAQRIMADCEAKKMTTKEFYQLLQQWIGDKILVDKTPSYPLDIEILKRAEADFADVKYIHLTRHPYATIYSFLEAKLDKNFFRYKHPFSRRELAELIWIVCHQNIIEFLKDIPADRQLCVRFEDLLAQPEPVVKEICRFLEIEYHPEMLKPYQGKRMTDGVTQTSQMVGDFKFYLHKKIDPNAADRWKRMHSEDFLSDVSWQIAETLGYKRAVESETTDDRGTSPTQSKREKLIELKPISREGELPLSFQQQRLWFLDQMEPGSAVYNIPVALQITGKLDAHALQQSLNEIARRHEVLRTNFSTVDGKPVQTISPERKVIIQYKNLSGLPEAEREIAAQQQAVEETITPFNLATDHLIRGRLLKLDEELHVILLTIHHIVADGWSTGVIIQEFSVLYQAFAEGKPSPLPDLPLQYVDYAHWQREWLKDEVLEDQLNFWKEKLKNVPPILELPTDHPRTAEVTYHGASERFNFSRELTDAIKSLSKQEGVTEFMTLLAGFQTLLSRYSGQTDICVGTPIANRGRTEIESLIGFFVNTLVLRTDLSGNLKFSELLKKVQETAWGAYAHQDLPFEMLVDEIQPERDMSHTPLFQVMFAFQNTPVQEFKIPGLKFEPFQLKSVTAKFDLTLTIREFRNEFRGLLEYNTDLFDATTIQRMVGHLQNLFEAIVHNPEAEIIRLPLLNEAEMHRILRVWNETQNAYQQDACIHQLFEAQAKRAPDAVAVVYENEHLTYRELNQRANQLAHYLRKLGVECESLVGLCMERSVELIIGLLGILKAGGAYVPLDPSYPAERLRYILEDAGAPILLTLEQSGIELPGNGTRQVRLDADWPVIASESKTNPKNHSHPENLAYLIYTSGSTGRPKGVMIQHSSVINLWAGLHYNIYDYHNGESLRISLNAPLLFDASVQQIVMLMSGYTLDILPQEARQDGEALLAYLRNHRVDVLDCVPSQLKLLLGAGLLDGKGWSPSIILPGGEAIDDATWQVLSHAPATDFYNMYGPTECTVDSTACPIKMAGARPVIGRPINNAQFYILDSHMEPVPVGIHGELYIAGDGLARGYHQRAELTAEKFIPDPFGNESGARMYKTGDLVRYLPDGNVEFLGRIDHQVKVRGFRIELGEIEATLAQHPDLNAAVVIVREDIPANKRLVAYVVPKNEHAPGVNELRSHLKTSLPDYMIPAAFVFLDILPLTPNGKIDRQALPAPDQSRAELEGEFVAPRTATEEKLAAIWCQVLRIDQVGMNDNFFELGGDSILSIQVISKANQAGIRLSPKQLFQQPTIAGLAALAGTTKAIQAEQGLVTGHVPLTPIQRQFFGQNLPEPHHWNQSVLLEVKQKLDASRIETVVKHLLIHHDALRLRFKPDETGWQQNNVAFDDQIPFMKIDLSAKSFTEQKTAIESTAAQVQSTLNLSEGPLLRVIYFDLGANQSDRLLMVVHHLAIDAVSWRILLEDFQTAYAQLSRNEKIQLPAKTTSFRQWAMRLSEYAQSEEVVEELDYWSELTEPESAPLAVDLMGGENTEALMQNSIVSLNAEETRALLQEVPSAYGTEINDVLLTALVQSFSRWTGKRALLVELEGHGRENLFDDMDASRTIGWFTTTYPVYLNLKNASAAGDAIMTIKEQLRRISNRGIGYGLLKYLNDNRTIEGKLNAIPAAEVGFNYLGQLDQVLPDESPFALAKESMGPMHSPRGKRNHLFDVNASVIAGQLQVSWTYNQTRHRQSTVNRLAEDYLIALRNLITHCQSPEAGGYTESDFKDVGLDQEEINNLMEELYQT